MDIDTLVLGCTHYPLLKNVISKVLGDRVTLIDSAIETAREIRKTLEHDSLINDGSTASDHLFYVTDSPRRFTEIGERFLGRSIEQIQQIKLKMEG